MLAKLCIRLAVIGMLEHPKFCWHIQPACRSQPRNHIFFLRFGHDSQLPSEAALTLPQCHKSMDIYIYNFQLLCCLVHAWKLTQDNVKNAQKC